MLSTFFLRRFRPICTTAVLAGGLFAATLGMASPRSTVPSVFDLELKYSLRYFDGVELTSVMLTSPRIAFITDTFGAWVPLDNPLGSAGFTLRHRSMRGVTMNISLLDTPHASEAEASWSDYVTMVQQQLGAISPETPEALAAGPAPRTIRVLGGETRTRHFTAPDLVAEFHVVTTSGRATVAFIIHGPEAAVEDALGDLWFFLSRLDRVQR